MRYYAWTNKQQRARGSVPVADRIIDNPIINSPYKAPEKHFKFDDEGITNVIVAGRRPSQYFVPVPRPRKRGQQIELDFAEFTADKIRLNDFVNEVRARVDLLAQAGLPERHAHHAAPPRVLVRPQPRQPDPLRPAGGRRDRDLPRRGRPEAGRRLDPQPAQRDQRRVITSACTGSR